jgi:hypothetical protein
MEILNQIPGTVVNWEPLQVELGVVPKTLNFGWRPLIKPDDANPVFVKLFTDIFTFRIYNKWTTKFLTVKRLLTSKFVITKFVRANQLLPWFAVHFKDAFLIKPILLVRHPIPNCLSQLKTFQNIKPEEATKKFKAPRKFNVPRGLNNDRFDPHIDFITSLNSILERTIAVWCVNNVGVIQHKNKQDWNLLFYEDLMLDPQGEVLKILKESNLEMDENIFVNFDFGKASASNYKRDYKKDTQLQLGSFLNRLDKDYLQKIQRIFDYFEFSTYNAFGAFPIKN